MIKVLDHGHVRLVEHVGDDLSIVRAARVSYDAEWRSGEDEGKDAKLIHYLYRNKHTSPFEMVDFTFDCKMPIFVARQWVRHRTASINEVSARYTELPEEFYLPRPGAIGVQSKGSKQARDLGFEAKTEERKSQIELVDALCKTAFELYRMLLEKGWPRELARIVLPVNVYTHWFWKIDLHNLFRFLELRLHEHAQYEIQVYAEAILRLITPVVPVAVEAFRSSIKINRRL
jgi:thymidylate synthase (FAD)